MSALAVLLLSLVSIASCQEPTSIVYPTTAASSATPLPSASGYKYIGCWNETTGISGQRALSGGNSTTNNSLTVESCLAYCAQGFNGRIMYYAGLEYGRECYCGANLLSISEKVDDTRCNYACNGNPGNVCGGSLALSLYNRTSESSAAGTWSLHAGQPVGYALLAAVTLLVAALI